MTLLEKAKAGEFTEEIKIVAEKEDLEPEFVRQGVADGNIVITVNRASRYVSVKGDLSNYCLGIGKGLRTKVNANIGTSTDKPDLIKEIEKLNVAGEAGADTIMDLSIGGNLRHNREILITNSSIPLGTVPIYEAAIGAAKREGMVSMSKDNLFNVIEEHAMDRVDFVTVHCGVTRKAIEVLKKHPRLGGIVSRGGAMLTTWMLANDKENPLYEHYDELLDIAREYDVILSLGDGLRPGCIADATDPAQLEELRTLGELTKRAWAKGVQVMIEGPGHIPLNQIQRNVELEKEYCNGAPFYVLGPLPTDVAAGYDHITCAIGGALASMCGADFLCYVTPKEHLGLPDVDDVREGVIVNRIAAHIGDIAKGVKNARDWDDKISEARKNLDFDLVQRLSLDPRKAKVDKTSEGTCTMCGEYCAINIVRDYLKLE